MTLPVHYLLPTSVRPGQLAAGGDTVTGPGLLLASTASDTVTGPWLLLAAGRLRVRIHRDGLLELEAT